MSTTLTGGPSEDVRQPLTFRAGTATFGIALIGVLGANLVPLMLIALSAQGVESVMAGGILTASLLATATVCIATASFANHSRRYVAMGGLLTTAAGFGVAALTSAVPLLAFGIIVGGAGAGAAASAAGAALAAMRNSVRVSGINGIVNRGIVALLLFILPLWGLTTSTVFGVAAAVALALVPFAHMLPFPPAESPKNAAFNSRTQAPAKGNAATGFALLICFGIWGLSEDAVWAVVGTVATTQVGLDEAQLGSVLGIATLVALIPPVLMSIAGNKLGRSVPLSVAVLGTLLLKAALGWATTPGLFIALIICWSVLYSAAFMYVIATAAALDPSGRWSSPIVGAYLVGSAVSPLYATAVSQILDLTAFGLSLAGLSALVVVPFVLIARKASRVERTLTVIHHADRKEAAE